MTLTEEQKRKLLGVYQGRLAKGRSKGRGTGSGGSRSSTPVSAYQPPVWISETPSDLEINGTRLDIIGTGSNQSAYTQDFGIDLTSGFTYVFQFNTDMLGDDAPRIAFSTNADAVDQPPIADNIGVFTSQLRLFSNLTNGGFVASSFYPSQLSGTIIIDTAANTIAAYDSSGNIVGAAFDYTTQGTPLQQSYYLTFYAVSGAELGEFFEFYHDKNLFPYTLPSGLPSGWKQIGE